MCDRLTARTARALLLALASGVCAVRSASAQDLAPLKKRLIAADRAYVAAHDSLSAVIDSARNAREPNDSIVAGAITLKYTASDLSDATRATITRAAAVAWKEAQTELGSAATRVASNAPIIVNHRRWVQSLEPNHVDFTFKGMPSRANTFIVPLKEREVADELLDLLGTIAAIDEPPKLKIYDGAWIPTSHMSPQWWSSAAVDLATSNTAVARDCFGGSTKRCESALGLVDVNDPLVDWYSDEDIRLLVSRLGTDARLWPNTFDEREECVSGKAPAVCMKLARLRPVPRPLNVETRRSVLGLALELGGPEAYNRLISAKGSALDILAAAAGISGDSLVGEWQKRVRAASPERVRPQALEASAMLAWTLLFAFGATRRRP